MSLRTKGYGLVNREARASTRVECPKDHRGDKDHPGKALYTTRILSFRRETRQTSHHKSVFAPSARCDCEY